MSYDFNEAEKQAGFDPIPAGTVVPLTMTIRPGGAGEGGWLKQSQSSDAQMLDCEFIAPKVGTRGGKSGSILWFPGAR